MDIKFSCSKCDQHIAVAEAGAGLTVACPNCKQDLIVPSATMAVGPYVSPTRDARAKETRKGPAPFAPEADQIPATPGKRLTKCEELQSEVGQAEKEYAAAELKLNRAMTPWLWGAAALALIAFLTALLVAGLAWYWALASAAGIFVVSGAIPTVILRSKHVEPVLPGIKKRLRNAWESQGLDYDRTAPIVLLAINSGQSSSMVTSVHKIAAHEFSILQKAGRAWKPLIHTPDSPVNCLECGYSCRTNDDLCPLCGSTVRSFSGYLDWLYPSIHPFERALAGWAPGPEASDQAFGARDFQQILKSNETPSFKECRQHLEEAERDPSRCLEEQFARLGAAAYLAWIGPKLATEQEFGAEMKEQFEHQARLLACIRNTLPQHPLRQIILERAESALKRSTSQFPKVQSKRQTVSDSMQFQKGIEGYLYSVIASLDLSDLTLLELDKALAKGYGTRIRMIRRTGSLMQLLPNGLEKYFRDMTPELRANHSPEDIRLACWTMAVEAIGCSGPIMKALRLYTPLRDEFILDWQVNAASLITNYRLWHPTCPAVFGNQIPGHKVITRQQMESMDNATPYLRWIPLRQRFPSLAGSVQKGVKPEVG